ncbi:PucR family transcriptional regulator ligand-binding domain-containing protein [Leucobacter sp. CSA1]|uniref:PucR family transcriptional regulator ligand-binding domain-containing protein n=1 Tax=Leucobacter chromiisoli TaxID=2796471 RepID=A0A934UVG5_9MICO|nr:PucR family transcriptional regulator ligand-binding domain-containing protein [Leucobacter chromiisoli]MBK0418922.1 PucR family transcriptional regulator ligand-binding domain-containing protein [Leucobacter chromiisoli]
MLQFESLVAADPVVVAGAAGLAKPVRWVHISELADIAGHLQGREMILTTGIALPEDDAGLARYIAELARVDTSAVVVGLGPHFERSLPLAMMEAADEFAIPLIVLRRHTAFVGVTEDVHARLVDSQIEQLQLSAQIHETLSTMVLQGSTAKAILEQVSRLSGRPAVLENLHHELLEVSEGARLRSDVIAEWSEHTRRHQSMRYTDYDPRTGWLVTTVGIKGDVWGRLIIMSAADEMIPRGLEQDPLRSVQATLLMLIERAASTIALGRLVERDRGTLRQQTHFDVISGLLAGGTASEEAADVAAAIGFPVENAWMAAVAVTLAPSGNSDARAQQDRLHQVAEAIRSHCASAGVPYLAAQVEADVTLALVAAESDADADQRAQALAHAFGTGSPRVAEIALSEPVRGAKGAAEGLAEALETARFARILEVSTRPVRRTDLGLEGLVLSLADDPRLRSFSRRTLSALRVYDAQHDTDLINALRYFLFAGRNKSLAAKRAFVSRPWLYEQLDRVEKVLGVQLDDESVCLELQVAILSEDVRARAAPGDAPRSPHSNVLGRTRQGEQ